MSEANFIRYLQALETLAPATLEAYGLLLADDVRFADPFQDVHGRDRAKAVFAHMFTVLDDVQFRVRRHAWSVDGHGFAAWDMTGVWRKSGRPWRLAGVSEIFLNTAGQVTAHVDYWDAARSFYEGLPLLGGVLRAIRRRVAKLSQTLPR